MRAIFQKLFPLMPTGPYLCIVDEYAAIVTLGFEVVLTQGREPYIKP